MSNWIQDTYFPAVIEEYTLPDITNLLFITGCEKGKCAAPLGLYVCKCMELWGFLIAEEDYGAEGNAVEKIMSYLTLTLGNEDAAILRPAIEFCNVPYALLGAGGFGITVVESYSFFENRILNVRKLAKLFTSSLDKLYELLSDESIAARASRRLKMLGEG